MAEKTAEENVEVEPKTVDVLDETPVAGNDMVDIEILEGPVARTSKVDLRDAGVAAQAERSGGKWQDRLGCGVQPQTHLGFNDIMKTGRICTDIPWLVVFILFFLGMFAVVYIPAFIEGNVDWIVYGVDYNKRVCGKSAGVTTRPFIMWPNPSAYGLRMCAENCSSTENSLNVLSNSPGIGIYESTELFDIWCIPTEDLEDPGKEYCNYKEVFVILGIVLLIVSCCGFCCVLVTKKFGWICGIFCFILVGAGIALLVLGFECGDLFRTSTADTVLAKYDNFMTMLTKHIADLNIALPVILSSFAIAVGIGGLYVLILMKIVRCVVWTAIGFITIACFMIGVLFFVNVSRSESSNQTQAEQFFGVLAFIATFIFICVIYACREQIEIACAVIEVSSKVLADVPTLFVFPFCPIILGILCSASWIYTQLYVFSDGDWTTVDMPASLVNQTNQYEVFPEVYEELSTSAMASRTFGWSFFLFLWTFNIIVYWAYMVVAGTVADWYFTVTDDSGEKRRGPGINQLADNPIWSSMKRTTFNHLGSVFYAAIILSVIQLIRLLFEYLHKMTNNPESSIARCIFACVRCFLYCVQKCYQLVGKGALVWIAIFGDCFCESAWASGNLMWDNLGRVAFLAFASDIVIKIGKFFVFGVSTGVAGLIFLTLEPYKSDMSSISIPLITAGLVNYYIGWIFMVLYDTAIDTIFLCFLIDEENNEGHMLADEALLKLVNDHKKESEEAARRRRSIIPHGKSEMRERIESGGNVKATVALQDVNSDSDNENKDDNKGNPANSN